MKNTDRIMISGLLIALMTVAGCGKKLAMQDVGGARTIPVVLKEAAEVTFTESLSLQGDIISESYALVPAKTGGAIVGLLVKEGDKVVQDQPLCLLDSEKQERGVEASRQALSVARSAKTVACAQAEQAATSRNLAARDYERYRKLSDDNAISIRQFDVAETQWKNSEAAYKVAEAQVELATAQVNQAETALAIAERDLRDATVRAPIPGVISVKFRELGEMMEAGKPVFRIDSPAAIEISAYIPVRYYNRIRPGESHLRARVNGCDLGTIPITYRSPIIDESLRTFEVKAMLASPPDGVVAGSMADVEVVLESHEGRGVPVSAVLRRAGKSVVFMLDGSKARHIPVLTGIQTDGLIEILDGLPAGSVRVVVKGHDLLNDGDAVSEMKE